MKTTANEVPAQTLFDSGRYTRVLVGRGHEPATMDYVLLQTIAIGRVQRPRIRRRRGRRSTTRRNYNNNNSNHKRGWCNDGDGNFRRRV